MKTAGQLKREIIDQVWPSNQPENLVSAHNLIFQEAFAEVSKWVACEQTHQVNVIDACKTNYKCGMTIVSRVKGIIRRVYTVANSEFCDPVFYEQRPWPAPECLARNVLTLPTSEITSLLPQLKLGFQPYDKTLDSLCGRSRTGVWSHHQNNLYIAPWVQSNEKIVIEWEGIKTEWSDEDPINEAQDYKKAIKLYYQYGHERDYGDMNAALLIHNRAGTGTFDEALADLMWQCNEEMKVRATDSCARERNRFWTELQDDAVPADAVLTVAHLSGYGGGAGASLTVEDQVKAWAPNAILASGAIASAGDYDLKTGQPFHDYIFPYSGAYGSGAASNKFWPAIGGDEGSHIDNYKAFFTLPNNEEWYDVCIAPIHFFFLNSQDAQDINLQTAVVERQRAWLNVKLMLSTAPWKVVVLGAGPQLKAGYDFDFTTMGANLVLSGSVAYYERYIQSGINYIINGLANATLNPSLPSVHPVRQFATVSSNGAGKISATKDYLTYDLIGVDGTILDTVTLTK